LDHLALMHVSAGHQQLVYPVFIEIRFRHDAASELDVEVRHES
jgi:hypothetical protein